MAKQGQFSFWGLARPQSGLNVVLNMLSWLGLRTKDRIITEPVTVPNVILTQPWNVYVEGRYVYTHMDATFSWLKTE